MTNDNSYIFKYKEYRKYYREIDQSQLTNFIISHPNPYSLKAIKDLFLCLGFKGKAFNIPKSKIEEIPIPFITLVKDPNEFVVIKSIEKNSVKFYNDKGIRKCSYEDFLSRWSGNVYIADLTLKPNRSTLWSTPDNKLIRFLKKNISLFLIILIAFVMMLASPSLSVDTLKVFFLFIPLVACYKLIRIESGNVSQFDNKVCNAYKRFNCQKILNSKIARPLGLFSLAEIGFLFFTSIFFLIITLSIEEEPTINILKLICLFFLIASPVSLFLSGYQIFKTKSICPYCTIIQLSTIILGAFYFSVNTHLSFINYNLLSLVFPLITALIITFFVSSFHSEKEIASKAVEQNCQLKRLKGVFETLKGNIQLKDEPDNKILLKSKIGNPMVIFTLSLNCIYCFNALKEYKHILYTIPDIGLGISFYLNLMDQKEIGGFLSKIVISYEMKDGKWIDMLDKWYTNPKYRQENSYLPFDKHITENYIKWSEENEISSTPVLILDNYILSQEITPADLSDYLRLYYT